MIAELGELSLKLSLHVIERSNVLSLNVTRDCIENKGLLLAAPHVKCDNISTREATGFVIVGDFRVGSPASNVLGRAALRSLKLFAEREKA